MYVSSLSKAVYETGNANVIAATVVATILKGQGEG